MTGLTIGLVGPLAGAGGTIPASDVTIYREAYYDVVRASDTEGAPGPWPDALIPTVDPWRHEPRRAFPISVPAGENRVAWVDVLVPTAAAAGTYQGVLSVSWTASHVTIPVRLTVLNWTMPSTSSLVTAFGMDWDTPCLAAYGNDCITHEADGWALKSLYVRAALDNRISIPYVEYQPINSPQERAYFEQYMLPLIDGTAPTRLPGARLTAVQVDNGSPDLASWREEAGAKGFADRSFVYACDEPGTDAGAWSDCLSQARLARSIWPQVHVLVTATIDELDHFGAATLVDRLVPIVNYMDDKTGSGSGYEGDQRARYDTYLSRRGNRLWLYTSCMSDGCSGDSPTDPYFNGWPGYVIDQPATQTLAMGWQSFSYGATGELYYAIDHDLASAWTDQYAFKGNGDGTLFYPGNPRVIGGTSPVPIESLRLKLIRDGLQDYEYLHFLAAHGQGARALAVVRTIFPVMYRSGPAGGEVMSARRQLADMLAGVVGGPQP